MWVLPAHGHHFCVHHHGGQEAGNSGGDCGGQGDGNGGEGSRRWVLLKVSSKKLNSSNTSQKQEEMVSTAGPSLHAKLSLCFEIPFLTQPHIQNHHQKNLSPGGKHKCWCPQSITFMPWWQKGLRAFFHQLTPSHRDLWWCFPAGAGGWSQAHGSPQLRKPPLPWQGLCATAALPGAGLGLQHAPPLKEQLRQMCNNPGSSLHFFTPVWYKMSPVTVSISFMTDLKKPLTP